jgi:hypothetical protein
MKRRSGEAEKRRSTKRSMVFKQDAYSKLILAVENPLAREKRVSITVLHKKKLLLASFVLNTHGKIGASG